MATADAYRLAALNSPDGQQPLPETSPVKVPAKPGFVPLSPGPEKAKLHMDAVASLLGLSSVDKQQAAALAKTAAKTTVSEPALNEWTVLPSTRPGAPLRAAKRLSSSEIYSRSLSIPRTIFEPIFGKQSSTTTTALIEPSAGALLALAAEAAAGSQGSASHFSLRAGPLVNALRATAGDVIVLTALDTDTTAAGETPPRARASVGYPTDVPTSGTGNAGTAAGGTATALAYGHESRSASGSPGSLDSLTHALSEGVNDGTEEEPSNAYAAAATLTATDHLGSSEALDAMEDPEWHHGSRGGGASAGGNGPGTRTRGRPRKRRPYGSVGSGSGNGSGLVGSQRAAAAAAVNLSCSHCGTRETPRWWKDAFPHGTLCNACGIWLKRHGYPRPVQFFSVPSAAGAPPAAAPTGAVAANGNMHRHQGTSQQGPSPGEFYLINGRPKRRRAAMNSTFGRGDGQAGSAMAATMVAAAAHNDAQDAAINYQAAGGRVFVMRRKLVANPDDGIVIAALVHFGWAPAARAAHEMFEKVSSYGTRSSAITVEDFELLGDTKATATLTLRTDAGEDAPEDWDALVRDFIETL